MITPLDTAHRVVAMATERGLLQELIFDNKVLFSHRPLQASSEAYSGCPGSRETHAQAQLKSRHIEALITNTHRARPEE